MASMLLKGGNREVVLRNLKDFLFSYKKHKKKSFSSLFKVKKKTKLSFVMKTILAHRIPGRMKKRYLGKRASDYPSYISFYKQWRRTARFLGVFFKKRGRFQDKFRTEIAKLRSKNFHFRRDSILNRTTRLFTGLNLKFQQRNKNNYEEGFFIPRNDFIEKYFQENFSKYEKSFKNLNFIKKAYPKRRW